MGDLEKSDGFVYPRGGAIHGSNGAFSKNIKIFKIIELLEEYEHFRKRAKIVLKKSRLRRGKMFFFLGILC